MKHKNLKLSIPATALIMMVAYAFPMDAETIISDVPTASSVCKVNADDLWYISVDPTYMEVKIGHTKPITVDFFSYTDKIDFDRTVSWSSLDTSIAVVDDEGNVTGKASGTTIVRATAANGKRASCRVRVFNNINNRLEVAVAGTDCPVVEEIMVAGSTLQLYSSFNDTDVTEYTEWNSSDPEVAEINPDGTVTCLGEGTATITAIIVRDEKEYEAQVSLLCFRTMTPTLKRVEVYEEAFLARWSEVSDAEYYIFEMQWLDTELDEYMPQKPVRFILDQTSIDFDSPSGGTCRFRVLVYSHGREFEPTEWCVVDMTNAGNAGIKIDVAEIDYSAPYEVYGPDGRLAGHSIEGLPKGIYIIRQNGNALKVMKK